MCFSYSKPREIDRGLKRIWDSQMGGKPSSARILKDVDLALKSLKIVYHENGSARIGHKMKEVSEGKHVS